MKEIMGEKPYVIRNTSFSCLTVSSEDDGETDDDYEILDADVDSNDFSMTGSPHEVFNQLDLVNNEHMTLDYPHEGHPKLGSDSFRSNEGNDPENAESEEETDIALSSKNNKVTLLPCQFVTSAGKIEELEIKQERWTEKSQNPTEQLELVKKELQSLRERDEELLQNMKKLYHAIAFQIQECDDEVFREVEEDDKLTYEFGKLKRIFLKKHGELSILQKLKDVVQADNSEQIKSLMSQVEEWKLLYNKEHEKLAQMTEDCERKCEILENLLPEVKKWKQLYDEEREKLIRVAKDSEHLLYEASKWKQLYNEKYQEVMRITDDCERKCEVIENLQPEVRKWKQLYYEEHQKVMLAAEGFDGERVK